MTTGRFAPTPSGDLHLGNLRTAMLAWCFARHDGGGFLLRIDDLTTGAAPLRANEQLEDLAALGIDHDGEIVAQSQRRDRYDDALQRLESTGLTYPCWCSRRDIRDAAAAPHGPSIDGAYPGTCRDLTEAEVAQRLASRPRPPATRLRAGGVSVEVDDRRLGRSLAAVDDFVVRRGDGVAAYNLAVVVDDADQGVDQVVRGQDLLETTPRQVLLQHLLGLPTPEYLHVPLVLGPDGARLSKRNGAVGLRACLAEGDDVARVVGRLAASIGLAAPGERLSASEVLGRFDPHLLVISDTLPA